MTTVNHEVNLSIDISKGPETIVAGYSIDDGIDATSRIVGRLLINGEEICHVGADGDANDFVRDDLYMIQEVDKMKPSWPRATHRTINIDLSDDLNHEIENIIDAWDNPDAYDSNDTDKKALVSEMFCDMIDEINPTDAGDWYTINN